MELVSIGQPFNFNWAAFDQNNFLFVAFQVYDVTSGAPILVDTVPGVLTTAGAYCGTYTGLAVGKTYLVVGGAYTDGTFTVYNDNYSQGADSFQVAGGEITFFPVNYVAYDGYNGLFIRSAIYDITTGMTVFVSNVDLINILYGVYFASFTGLFGHTYAAISVVFTDGTYTTPDPNRSPGCESFDAILAGNTTIVLESAVLTGQSLRATLEAIIP